MTKQNDNAVLVTTAHRGVFFGYERSRDGTTIKLSRARNCLYWSADVRGFMGLAERGPTASCRVGPPAEIELFDVTSICEVTPKAVEAWERAPWK
jgi:hypothetical protein